MADSETSILEIDGKVFVPWKANMKHPKLSWVIEQLNSFGIAHMVGRKGDTSMLYVEQGNVAICDEILTQELGTVRLQGFECLITPNDLPDAHGLFQALLDRKPEPPVPDLIKETLDDMVTNVVEGNFVPPEPVVTVVEEDDDDWDEDDDDDGWGISEDEISPIIDIEATVTDAKDVTDPDFDNAEEAPVPVPKPKAKKAEPKPANDPDFEAAIEPESNPAEKVTGTEFLRVDEELTYQEFMFPTVLVPIRMYDMMSSNISAFGFKPIDADPLTCTVYVRFKSGASIYRYNPVPRADVNETLNVAIRKVEGRQDLSIGSFLYHTITDKANEGLISCQRLSEGGDKWVKVLPKKERIKQTKERAKQS